MPAGGPAGHDVGMLIIQHGLPVCGEEPGVQRIHLAGPGRGFHGLDCWLLTLAPQASSEGRTDEGCEQALIVLSGLGKLLLAGAPLRFAAPCTLIVPPTTDYRIVCQGGAPMQLLCVRALSGRGQ